MSFRDSWRFKTDRVPRGGVVNGVFRQLQYGLFENEYFRKSYPARKRKRRRSNTVLGARESETRAVRQSVVCRIAEDASASENQEGRTLD